MNDPVAGLDVNQVAQRYLLLRKIGDGEVAVGNDRVTREHLDQLGPVDVEYAVSVTSAGGNVISQNREQQGTVNRARVGTVKKSVESVIVWRENSERPVTAQQVDYRVIVHRSETQDRFHQGAEIVCSNCKTNNRVVARLSGCLLLAFAGKNRGC